MNNYPLPEAATTEPEIKNGRLPETADLDDQFLAGLEPLEKALAENDQLSAELEALIQVHGGQKITAETINALYDGLVYYLDDDAIDFLLSLLTGPPNDELYDKVQGKAAAQTWHWLRRLLALYGGPLREAYAISGVNDNAWRWLNRRVYYDTVTARWGISLELILFNGERINLEETPISALSLAQGIVDSLNTIPPDVAPDLMDGDLLDQFLDECSRLKETYIGPEKESMPEESSIDTTHIEG